MQVDVRIELRSDPRLLRCVRGMVRGYVAGYGFDADKQDEVVLAVDEACANAIRHSYTGRLDGVVLLQLSACDGWVVVELCDEGLPCPEDKTVPKPLCDPSLDALTPGGLGIQLMHEVFDEVLFSPGVEKGNRVTMRLKRPQPEEAA